MEHISCELELAPQGYFMDLLEFHFKIGIELLVKHWAQFIEVDVET